MIIDDKFFKDTAMKTNAIRVAMLVASVLTLTACVRTVTSTPGDAPNLEEFVASIKAEKPKEKRDPLPLLLEQTVFSYADHTTVTINPNPQSAVARAAGTETSVSEPENTETPDANETDKSHSGEAKDEQVKTDNSPVVESAAPIAQAERKPLRSPFDYPQTQESANSIRPDSNRPKQALEAYELDSLKMVGTLGNGAGLIALVQSPDKVVYRVSVGNYLGMADGRIVGIKDNEIKLLELVSDGNGGWIEQPATIVLIE